MREACPDPSVLDDLASGRIPPERRPALEAHLDTCAECARVVATLADLFASGMASHDATARAPSIAYGPTVDGRSPVARTVDPTPRQHPSAPPPPSVGRYRLLHRLGAGGMGVVFAAHDPELDRRVAVKLLHPDASGNEGHLEHQRARLMREAQSMAKLSHPNVVAVFDVGRVGAQLFLAMELVEGTTLGQWLRARPRSRDEVLGIFTQAARGLAAAHAVGLVHRDFKPDNVLVGLDGRARVTDFGLARPLDVEARAGAAAALHVPMQTLAATAPGALVGTPAYMAPEQWRGEAADARSDQFAFCLTLYEALFLQRAFAGESLRELAENVLAGRVRPMPQSTPRWIRALLTRGLALIPSQRHPSMDAIIEELARDHHHARRIAIMGGTTVLGAALLVGALHVGTKRPPDKPIAVTPSTSASVPAECAALRMEVKEIWTEARRQDIDSAFKDATRSWARNQTLKVAKVLDGWSSDWIDARKAACAAKAPSEPRVQCLDERLRVLDALLTELGRADASTLQHAVTAAEHLPSPRTCNEPSALARRPAPPAKELQPKVALLEKELATTWAMIELGHAKEARSTAERLEKDAKAIAWEPAMARAAWLFGNAAFEDADGKAAVERLTQAATLAQSSKDGDLLIFAAADLVVIQGAVLDQGEEAARWAKVGESEAKREGADARARLSLASAVGAWRLREHKPREARDAFKLAIDIGEEHLGETHGDVASALSDLSTSLVSLDDFEKAQKHAKRAIKIAEERFGPEHPLSGTYRKALADALLEDGQTAEAVAEYERALKIRDDALHLYDPDLSTAIDDLGRALAASGKLVDAEKKHLRALGLREKILTPDHPDVAFSLMSIGDLRLLQGKTEEGLGKHKEAIAYLERVLIAGETRIGEAMVAYGDALVRAGRAAPAVAQYQSAITLLGKRFGEHSPRVAVVQWKLGLALEKKGEPAKALAQLDDITLTIDSIYGSAHRRVGILCADRARVAMATGDKKRAAELYGVALSTLEKALGEEHPDTVAVRKALALAQKN